MTQRETDGDRQPTTRERFLEWSDRPASVTNGHLLISRLVWTFFLAMSAFVGYRQLKLDNKVTRESVAAAVVREGDNCAQSNARIVLAKDLAENVLVADRGFLESDQKALDSDEANWNSIDELFPDGFPEPARSTIFQGLADRQADLDDQQQRLDDREKQIDVTYVLAPCDQPVEQTGGDALN
jgi:hypothetical protein